MFEFHPKRLTEVLETVRGAHSVRRGEAPEIGKSFVDEVREILSQTEFTDLNKIIFQFDSKRLLACIEIISVDREGDIADKAAHAVRMRPKEPMMPIAWFKLIKNYPHPLLEFLLNELIKEKGGRVIENHPKISNHAIRWLMDNDLSQGIIKDYRTVSESPDFDEYLKNHFLNEQDSLYVVAWQNLLMKGVAADIRKQKSDRVLEVMAMEIKSANSIRMGQNYLNTLKTVKDWDESILIYINKKWDRPMMESTMSASENRFWKGISTQSREEFHKWLMHREIGDFFEGERADFWRDYIEPGLLIDIDKILNGNGFLLSFSSFGVVEFKQSGNAAYVYPKRIFEEYRRSGNIRRKYPVYFKDKSRTIRLAIEPGWDGRILHPQGWEEKAAERIKKLMKQK